MLGLEGLSMPSKIIVASSGLYMINFVEYRIKIEFGAVKWDYAR